MTFKERRKYRDTDGRMWVIKQIVGLEDGPRIMLVREISPVPRVQLAVDDDDGFATIFLKKDTACLIDEEWGI